MTTRRHFIRQAAVGAFATGFLPAHLLPTMKNPGLKLSLAEWSLHRTIRSGGMDHLDFARKAAGFGLQGIEYVNTFFKDKANNASYLAEMNRRAKEEGVVQLLIMIDEEGGLAETDDALRLQAVENHRKWIEAAHTLGCHSIRVNAHGESTDRAARHQAAVDGLGRLASIGAEAGLNVIVENHGGLSSDGSWLAGVIREVDRPNCGTLPDFGNFCLQSGQNAMGETACLDMYDRYRGVAELLPFAKAVSAKSFDFDKAGNETTIDFPRMMELVRASGYTGYVGIEYEGSRLSEEDGILATKALLKRILD